METEGTTAMSEVERYDQNQYSRGGASMYFSPDGDWVKYEDYKHIAQHLNTALGHLNAFCAVLSSGRCPKCCAKWSESEREQMREKFEASCICGYKKRLITRLLKPKGQRR